ncbi:MAG: hypothetical protein LH617_13105 [Ramlibacter sp.]|nr:hypothetical protein [Ramlibacter sp.]
MPTAAPSIVRLFNFIGGSTGPWRVDRVDVAVWGIGLAAGVVGLCLGVGAWWSTFASQWPVVRSFIDGDRVRDRLAEIERQRSRPRWTAPGC